MGIASPDEMGNAENIARGIPHVWIDDNRARNGLVLLWFRNILCIVYMLPTVVDLWPDCDLLAIYDGVTVVMVAEWDSRIVVDGVCVGHSQVLFLISTVQLLELNEQLSLTGQNLCRKSFGLWAEFAYKLTRAYTTDVKRYSFRWARKFCDVFYLA